MRAIHCLQFLKCEYALVFLVSIIPDPMVHPHSVQWKRPLNIHLKRVTLRLAATFTSPYEGGVCIPQRGFASSQFATGCRAESCRLQWNASAGRQAALVVFGRKIAVLLLTSVAGIVLCCASQGFCSIIGAHFITLFCGGVCTLAAEPSALNLCIARGFAVCIYSGVCAVWGAFVYISALKNCSCVFLDK